MGLRVRCRWLASLLCLLMIGSSAAGFERSGTLEIHYINVGQGGATLIIGPDGTRILYDFGNVGAERDIVPYLRERIDLTPEEGLHYTIVSHRDRDHYGGFRGVIEAGYAVLIANFGPGSPKPATSFVRKMWLDPAAGTRAGPVRPIPLGMRVPLGDGAELVVMAANGKILGLDDPIEVSNENDRSVALFLRYRNFHYLLDGDLGAGSDRCTQHQTRQKALQTEVAEALRALSLMPEALGVDVLHIAHHGSESSTSAAYYNLMRPEVGLISVGFKQGNFQHPRRDVVERVLLEDDNPDDEEVLLERAGCVVAPPLRALFQTEDGRRDEDCSEPNCTSFAGTVLGDIQLITGGRETYTIRGTGRVHAEAPPAEGGQEECRYPLDEHPDAGSILDELAPHCR